ncbi:MAG TPA: hypothetical protein ENI23_02795 [bacterium]|nr:hypothetical protein [bacterium]
MLKAQIFISHTKRDVRFCDLVDRLFAGVPIGRFRSEYENIRHPEWQTIKRAMNDSIALFLLVGRRLVENQKLKNLEWSHTQNWIAYEIGLACQLGIDVWAICDNVVINFPMPYVNNYYPMKLKPFTRSRPDLGLKKDPYFVYLKNIIERYSSGNRFPFPYASSQSRELICKYCGAQFNLHLVVVKPQIIVCPQCLRRIFIKGRDPASPFTPQYKT